ncbi:MAG: 30S ribosomal protein S20 [Planctomycetales bacterium]|nr:30S ribosomal protein S20 [Planctomycetales bacterium]
MPNIKSAEKRLRQSKVRNLRNRSLRSALRTQVKKLRAAIAEGNLEACQAEYIATAKKLDQAAAKKSIHPNAAARTKSRLNGQVKAIAGK